MSTAAMGVHAPRVKERPIIMQPESVVAIQAGRKTQTRRIVRGAERAMKMTKDVIGVAPNALWWFDDIPIRCPYGKPGDRLWVREPWRAMEDPDTTVDGIVFKGGMEFVPIANTRDAADRWVEAYDNGKHGSKWRSPLHMPRWACRLVLEITEVRAQRLHEISEEDARAEGVERTRFWDEDDNLEHSLDPSYAPPLSSYAGAFEALWDSINGDRAEWSTNPPVWAITFRRLA